MTEQARRYLSTYTATGSTSRALILWLLLRLMKCPHSLTRFYTKLGCNEFFLLIVLDFLHNYIICEKKLFFFFLICMLLINFCCCCFIALAIHQLCFRFSYPSTLLQKFLLWKVIIFYIHPALQFLRWWFAMWSYASKKHFFL